MMRRALADRLSPARRRFVLAVAAVLVALAVGRRGRRPHRSPRSTGPPVDQGTAGPVLLVPGYGGSAASLQGLATGCGEAGRDAPSWTCRTGPGRPDRPVGRARTTAAAGRWPGPARGGRRRRLLRRRRGRPALGGRGRRRRQVARGWSRSARRYHGTDVAGLGTAASSGTVPDGCRQLAPDSAVLLAPGRRAAADRRPGSVDLDHQRRGRPAADSAGSTDDVPSPRCRASARPPGDPRRPAERPRRAGDRAAEALGSRPDPDAGAPGDCARLSS